MNDSEFCSDAHRHSYAADEQKVAMERLMSSQPAAHRTQRVAVAKQETIAPLGGRIPYAFPAMRGGDGPAIRPEPFLMAASIQLMERRYDFPARLGLDLRVLPLPRPDLVHTPPSPAMPAQFLHSRIAIVAGAGGGLRRRQKRRIGRATTLTSISMAAQYWPVSASTLLDPETMAKQPALPHSQRCRERNLRAVDRLTAVPQEAAAIVRSGGHPIFTGFLAAEDVCHRPSGLRAIAPPAPEADPLEREELWAAFAESPLGKLLEATACVTVLAAGTPAAAPARAAIVSMEFPETATALPGASSTGRFVSGPAASLQPLAVLSAVAPCIPPAASPETAEPGVEHLLPGWETAGRFLSLAGRSGALLPLSTPPAMAGAHLVPAAAAGAWPEPAAPAPEMLSRGWETVPALRGGCTRPHPVVPPLATALRAIIVPGGGVPGGGAALAAAAPFPVLAHAGQVALQGERVPSRNAACHGVLLALDAPEAGAVAPVARWNGCCAEAEIPAELPARAKVDIDRHFVRSAANTGSVLSLPLPAIAVVALRARWESSWAVHEGPAARPAAGPRMVASVSLSAVAPLPERILPVLVPGVARISPTPQWGAIWVEHVLPAAVLPMCRPAETLRISPASSVSVPSLAPAGAQPRASQASPWEAPVPAAMPPGQPLAPLPAPALAGSVVHRLQPGPADSPLPAAPIRTLQNTLRIRLPRHASPLLSRYGTAGVVAVPAPAAQEIGWVAAAPAGSDLCPHRQVPARPAGPAPELRQSSSRLYRVPRAMPVAAQPAGRPASFPMGAWASAPAIAGSKLRFDDGKRKSRRLIPARFSCQLRTIFGAGRSRRIFDMVGQLPSDLKWIAMVVPLILGIWMIARPSTAESALPPVSVAAQPPAEAPEEAETVAGAVVPAATNLPIRPKAVSAPELTPAAVPPVEPTRWDILTARIASRASVDIVEDFHNGLSQWGGKGEWARTWSYDKSGTVRPGQMAIFHPSTVLRDYVLEMKASIERRSIQWMVRASGPKDYHFLRLNVTPGAPLTKLELERWSVVNGRIGRVTRLPLPHGGANQTLYAIRVEVKGDSVTTYLQDRVIDTFTDSRLASGGIGLAGLADDRPRIYGIHIYHQNDFLGKLCSFLTPQPISNQGTD